MAKEEIKRTTKKALLSSMTAKLSVAPVAQSPD